MYGMVKTITPKNENNHGGDIAMKIGLLASNPELYSNKRIMQAGAEKGHDMHFIRIEHCYMDIMHKNPVVHYRGDEVLKGFDAIIPRIKPEKTFYGITVLRQFAMQGAYTLNGPISIGRARDKLRTLQMLAREENVNVPRSCFADSPDDIDDIIKQVGGAPLVVKLLEGAQGAGVILAETDRTASSMIKSFKKLDANILVQEFIRESAGTDLRCFVIGEKVVGSMERRAPEGEFRSNIHLGGQGFKVKITPEERKMAVTAAKTMGLQVSGVDLIRSNKGPLVLEVNSTPGLEGIEGTTKKDIAAMMIDYIEKHAPLNKRRKLRDG